ILSMTTNALTYTAIAGDSLLFAATNFGSFISNDQGNTWMKSDSGIVAENFYGLAKLTNNKLFASTNLAVFLRNAANQTWSKSYPQNGYSGQVPVYADNAGVLYARDNSIPHNNNTAIPIVKSTDQGATWAVDTVGLSAITGDLFYIDETGTQYYANTRFGSSFPNYIWKRTPPGPWTIDTLGFRPTTSAFNSAMASDKNGYIYISGSFGGKKVMRRPIAGGAWEVDTAGLGSSLSRFAIMTTGYRGDVIGANGNLLYHKGSPWSRINLPAGLTSANITAISVDSAGNLFIALANSSNLGRGVYRTQNFGSTWTYAGLDSMYVAQLISYNDTTYALTLGNGLFALTAPVTALPVHFISVKATQQGQAINVQWNVADEENAEKYEVERSANERNFSTVGSVPARNRGSDSYSWLDQLPNAGDNFYRIKMIERTGRALYSQVVKINSNKKQTELMVYPNPAKGFVNVQLINVETGMYKMSLYKDAGKLIFSRDIQHSGGSETITFPVQFLSRGYYVLEIKGRQTLKVKLLIL
ncbi:MAG TPA: T9SS type A sorting domain-containing protein, partial [Flavisolibacter sp.]|nr:T9SS type A sorting domain-containing protein [Flavisolibacter sp.]